MVLPLEFAVSWICRIISCKFGTLSAIISSSTFSVVIFYCIVIFSVTVFFSCKIHLFLICIIHFFAEAFYLFAEILLVILLTQIHNFLLSIFMMEAIKYLSDNSNISHLGVSIYECLIILFGIFLDLGMMTDFWMKVGHFGYYVWYAVSYLKFVFYMAFSDVALVRKWGLLWSQLTPGGSDDSCSPLGLHCSLPGWQGWECLITAPYAPVYQPSGWWPYYQRVEVKVLTCLWESCDIPVKMRCHITASWDWKSSLPM